jgi:hypothetical protein
MVGKTAHNNPLYPPVGGPSARAHTFWGVPRTPHGPPRAPLPK